MIQVRIAPIAQSEIEEIVGYIAADNVRAADRVEEAIFRAIARLGDNPAMGHRRQDLTQRPLRFWSVMGRFTIVYLFSDELVQILRVFGPGRDIGERLL